MQSRRSTPRRALAAGALALSTLTVGLTVGLAGVSSGSAAADDPEPGPAATLELRVPHRQVLRAEGTRVYSDLGVRLLARNGPFQVNANRLSYDQPLVVTAFLGDQEISLPASAMKDFGGLTRFVRFELQRIDKKNQPVGEPKVIRKDACLGAETDRVSPDSVATSPFPRYCYYNPYSLGSVQGIQAGWAASLIDPYTSFKLAKGRYDLTVSLRPDVAAALGLAGDGATGTSRVIVQGTDDHHPHPLPPEGRVGQRAAATAPTGARKPPSADGPVPDLRSLPAWGIQLSPSGKYLQFSATVWNAGNSPLVVDGFRQPGKDLMDGYQYFFDADGNQVGYESVGQFEWDPKPTHQHWHFQDFASYTLLRADQSAIVKSRKEAFCLANTDAVDLTVEGADWIVDNQDLSTACGSYGSLSIREVLAAGWGDTYGQFRAGQSFRIDNLPNGTYYIEVKANPRGILVEGDEANNIALRKIVLGVKGTQRTVTVEKVGLIDEGTRAFG